MSKGARIHPDQAPLASGGLLSPKVLPWPDPTQAAKQLGFIKCPRRQSQTAGGVAL